jgi:hypothetical protein
MVDTETEKELREIAARVRIAFEKLAAALESSTLAMEAYEAYEQRSALGSPWDRLEVPPFIRFRHLH